MKSHMPKLHARRGRVLRDSLSFTFGLAFGFVLCRVLGMSGCVSSQYMTAAPSESRMNALILDNPREVVRLSAADPALLTWPAIEPFLSSLGAMLSAPPPDQLDWSAPVSPLISGRLDATFSGIRWQCIVDVVPSDIGPTRSVIVRIRAVLPADSQDPDVCTAKNFALMWNWARPQLQSTCAAAATSLPAGVRFSPAPVPANPPSPTPAAPAIPPNAHLPNNPPTRARTRRPNA